MKDDEPHYLRQFRVGDGRCLCRTAGGGGGRRKTTENSGKQGGTTGDDNAVRPGPTLLLVGQVQKKTGRDDTMSSVLVLVQDGRTTPLRIVLATHSELFIPSPSKVGEIELSELSVGQVFYGRLVSQASL